MSFPLARTAAMLSLTLWALAGCMKQEPLLTLELRRMPPAIQAAVPTESRLKVAIKPFEDARPEGSYFGTRTLGWGNPAYFNLEGGMVGDVVAQTLAEFLRHRTGWRAWLAKPGVKEPNGGPDFVLTGRVLSCEAQVKTWTFYSKIKARTKLTFAVTGPAGRETGPFEVESNKVTWTLGFDPRDVDALMNQALLDGFEEFVAKTDVLREKLVRRVKQQRSATGAD
jgi:hypothetical protein